MTQGSAEPDSPFLDSPREHDGGPVDLSAAWDELIPVQDLEDDTREAIQWLCERKHISFAALVEQGARVKRSGDEVLLAYAYRANGAISAIKYRDITNKKRWAESGSSFVEPMTMGNPTSLEWYICEGETDSARLWDLAGNDACTVCLPSATMWRREWGYRIPNGAIVVLALDADEAGDKGAGRIQQTIPNRTVRLRPPDDAGDWCEWDGDRQDFGELLLAAVESRTSGSWEARDLLALASEPVPEPTIGGGALYPGRRHLFSGEQDSLKTWFAVSVVSEQLQADAAAVWVRFDGESDGREILERLQQLGVSDDAIRERFIYVEPDEAATEAGIAALAIQATEVGATLAVFDSFSPLLSLHGLSSLDDGDIGTAYRLCLEPFERRGMATVILDHVPKDKSNRAYALGSQRKVSGSRVHLGFEPTKTFCRGGEGRAAVRRRRDSSGMLPLAGFTLDLSSDPETFAVTWELRANEIDAGGEMLRTFLMERVSEYTAAAGSAKSRNDIVEDVSGKRQHLLRAITQLVEREYLREDDDGTLHHVRDFREHADESEFAPVRDGR